jgi:transcriptional regulator with XRE-family HTH domain
MQHIRLDGVYSAPMDTGRGGMDVAMPTFGEWLRIELGKADRSASWLARQVAVKPQTIAAYLAGTARPGREKVPAIAAALGVREEIAWDAWRERPGQPLSDVTLVRLLDLPDDLTRDEVVMLRNLFRAIRQTEKEIGADERGDHSLG